MPLSKNFFDTEFINILKIHSFSTTVDLFTADGVCYRLCSEPQTYDEFVLIEYYSDDSEDDLTPPGKDEPVFNKAAIPYELLLKLELSVVRNATDRAFGFNPK